MVDDFEVLCPLCNEGNLEYTNSNDGEYWKCKKCHTVMDTCNFRRRIDDEGKYKVYRKYGANAVQQLTGEKIQVIRDFIGKYFESCCKTKRDKCVYYKQFNEIVKSNVKTTVAEKKAWLVWNIFEFKLVRLFSHFDKNEIEREEYKLFKYILSLKNGAYQSNLWKRFGMDRRKCSRIVVKLCEMGLISRVPCAIGVGRYRSATYKLYALVGLNLPMGR